MRSPIFSFFVNDECETTCPHRADFGTFVRGRNGRRPHASAEGRAACRIIYACKPMARGRRGPHADRSRQSDIKLDVTDCLL